jgi:hypothetical protein
VIAFHHCRSAWIIMIDISITTSITVVGIAGDADWSKRNGSISRSLKEFVTSHAVYGYARRP